LFEKFYFIESRVINDLLFYLSDYIENVRLVIVISIGTDTKVDFSVVSITKKCLIDTDDWVRRCHWYFSENVGEDNLGGESSEAEAV
jgi:hypothetical protein